MKDWRWYFSGIYSIADALAVPRIVARELQQALAVFLLDRTPIGKAVLVEYFWRQSLEKARASGAAVYCLYHDCPSEDCPAEGHED